jgi:hypothetical protein
MIENNAKKVSAFNTYANDTQNLVSVSPYVEGELVYTAESWSNQSAPTLIGSFTVNVGISGDVITL